MNQRTERSGYQSYERPNPGRAVDENRSARPLHHGQGDNRASQGLLKPPPTRPNNPCAELGIRATFTPRTYEQTTHGEGGNGKPLDVLTT